MDEDTSMAAWADQEQQEQAQFEATRLRHREFRRDCEEFERETVAWHKRIQTLTHTGA